MYVRVGLPLGMLIALRNVSGQPLKFHKEGVRFSSLEIGGRVHEAFQGFAEPDACSARHNADTYS